MKTRGMKLIAAAALLVSLVGFAERGNAEPANRTGEFGLGVSFGDMTSVTGKAWQHPDDAIDVALGGSSNGNNAWFVQGSYVKHFLEALGTSSRFISELSPYIGGGAGIGFNRKISDQIRSSDVFLRLPIGLAWLPAAAPLDVFVEVAPTVDITPVTSSFLTANLGARYYF